MTEDEHDTEAAPTEQASPPTTELPPANHAAAESVHAWSLDTAAEETHDDAWSLDTAAKETHDDDAPMPRVLVAALVVLVGTVGAAVITLGAMYFNQITSTPVAPSAIPLPPPCTPRTLGFETCLPAPPPPTAVTVTAAPPVPTVTATAAAPPAPALSSTDQQFLTALQNNGLSYPDPDYAISHAHATCDFMANHSVRSGNTVASNYVARTTIWTDAGQSAMFAMYSAFNYCPQSQSE
jgi:hypothetical protein